MSLQCPVGKRLFVVAAIATMSLHLGGLACGQERKPPANEEDQPSIWMKKKLDYSQNILAGLANADFNQIAENAQAMQGLSKLEWFIRGRTPGYRTQLEIFQDANAEIIKQAKQDNLEGASLAFTQLTISCVNCHKHLRSSKPK
jgi:hypothetical protein